MMVNGENLNLKQYMEVENKKSVDDDFYNETFANVVYDYLGSMGEFSENDIKFLNDNDYDTEDFIEDDSNNRG